MPEGLELHDKEVTMPQIDFDFQNQYDDIAISIESDSLLDNTRLPSFDECEGGAGQGSADGIAITIESDPLLDNLPLQSFDEDEGSEGQASATISAATMLMTVQTPTAAVLLEPIQDHSEAIPHVRSIHKPSKFKLAIGL
jgi:hypothetical protein